MSTSNTRRLTEGEILEALGMRPVSALSIFARTTRRVYMLPLDPKMETYLAPCRSVAEAARRLKVTTAAFKRAIRIYQASGAAGLKQARRGRGRPRKELQLTEE